MPTSRSNSETSSCVSASSLFRRPVRTGACPRFSLQQKHASSLRTKSLQRLPVQAAPQTASSSKTRVKLNQLSRLCPTAMEDKHLRYRCQLFASSSQTFRVLGSKMSNNEVPDGANHLRRRLREHFTRQRMQEHSEKEV